MQVRWIVVSGLLGLIGLAAIGGGHQSHPSSVWDGSLAPPKATAPVPEIDCTRFSQQPCWLGYTMSAASLIGIAVACKVPPERLAPFGERNFDVINSLANVDKERTVAIETLVLSGKKEVVGLVATVFRLR